MPIRFTCEECGKALKVSDKNAGKRAACPACQAIIRVPANDEEEERPSPAKKTARTGTRRRRAAHREDDDQNEEVTARVKGPAPELEDEEPEKEEPERGPEEEAPVKSRSKSSEPRRTKDEAVEKEPSEEEDAAAAEGPQEELHEEDAEAPADEETDGERDPQDSDSFAAEPTVTDADDWGQEAAEPEEVGPPLRKRIRRRRPPRAGGFGLASIVIGVLGLLLSWVPFFGIPLAGFGVTIGILGMWIAARGGRQDRLTIAGATISLLAVIPATIIALGVLKRSSKTAASGPSAAETSKGNIAVQTTPQPISLPAVPKRPPIPNAELVAFKQRMLAFVDEASALAELAQVKPDATDFGKKVDALTETYSEIPDEPAGSEALDKARTIAHQVWSELRRCRQTLQLADRVKQLGGEDAYRQTLDKLKQWGQVQKTRLEAIRAALADIDQTPDRASDSR